MKDSDLNFVPILAANFVSGARSFFDLYVRISSGRYLKILQANDSFSPERIGSYLTKTTYFYIRQENQELYLSYCDKMASLATKSEKISTKASLSLSLNQGQEVVNFLKSSAVHDSHIHYGISFANNLSKNIAKITKEKNVFFDEFL